MSKATENVQKARIANYNEVIQDLEEQLIQFEGDEDYIPFLNEQIRLTKMKLEEIINLGI